MRRRWFRLHMPSEIAARISSLHPQLKREVRAGLEAILVDPDCGKALEDELTGYRSYRMGRMRAVYRVEPGRVVYVLTVGPRATVYEEAARLAHRQ